MEHHEPTPQPPHPTSSSATPSAPSASSTAEKPCGCHEAMSAAEADRIAELREQWRNGSEWGYGQGFRAGWKRGERVTLGVIGATMLIAALWSK